MIALWAAVVSGTGLITGYHPLSAPSGQDPCGTAVEQSLVAEVTAGFPGYRLPRATDPHLARINGRDPQECAAVTEGDFNGDSQRDYALLLTGLDGNSAVLAAAIRGGSKWQFQNLYTYGKNELLNLYVTTAEPGAYKQPESGGDLKPGQARSFHSKRQGIMTGTLEASAVCYFWTHRGWVHVSIAD